MYYLLITCDDQYQSQVLASVLKINEAQSRNDDFLGLKS